MPNFARTDKRLRSPERVAAAQALLAEHPPLGRVERQLTDLATRLGVTLTAATVLDDETQHLLATSDGPMESTPATSSHCQYVIGSGEFLCISDAATDSTWKRLHRALVRGEPLTAYLGFPLRYHGEIVGAVCAVDTHSREWTSDEQYEVYRVSRVISDLLAA